MEVFKNSEEKLWFKENYSSHLPKNHLCNYEEVFQFHVHFIFIILIPCTLKKAGKSSSSSSSSLLLLLLFNRRGSLIWG
jgi:hypothetical protein